MNKLAFRFVSLTLAVFMIVGAFAMDLTAYATDLHDINQDGIVTVSDVTTMLDALAGHIEEIYDINGDGAFNVADVTSLLDYLAGYGASSDEDVIHPFDRAVGDINLPDTHGTAEYTTEKRYGDEKGSLKLTVLKDSEVYLGINAPLITDMTDYEYITFKVYNPTNAGVGVGTMWAADTVCAPGEWTEVRIATSLFTYGYVTGFSGSSIPVTNITGFAIRLISGFSSGDVFYISCVRAEKKDPTRANVIKAFDLNIDDINLPSSHGSAEYTTEMHYGDEQGALKLTVSKGSEVYLGINTPLIRDMTNFDYIVFRVYNASASTVGAGTMWAADTNCAPGKWTEVRVPVSLFVTGAITGFPGTPLPITDISGFVIRLISGFRSGDIFYISSVRGEMKDHSRADVVKPFDLNVNDINLPSTHGSAEYTTEKAFGEEAGSLKLTTAKSSEVYLGLNAVDLKDLTDYDYVYFNVYNTTSSAIMVGTFWTADTSCAPGAWTEVRVSKSAFEAGYVQAWSGAAIPATNIDGMVLRLISGFASGNVFYISSVRAGKNDHSRDDVVKPFDLNINNINLPSTHGTAVYTTEKAFGEEAGSLKLTTAKDSEVYLGLNAVDLKDLTDYDYVYFNVYNATSSAIMVGTFWAADTSCAPGEWTEVRVAKALFDAGYVQAWSGDVIPATNIDGLVIRFIDGFAPGGVFYISAVRAFGGGSTTEEVEKTVKIGGWDAPINTLEDYQFAKDMGLDVMYIDEVFAKRGSQAQAEIFDFCDQVGIDAVMILGNAGNTEHAQSSWQSDTVNYSLFPALAAINYWDEPYYSNFNRLAELADEHLAKYGDSVDFYVNHFPNSATGAFGGLSYSTFIRRYCENILSKFAEGHRFLSADIYPIENKNGQSVIRTNWLSCIETIATYAKQYNADTNFFIQLTEHDNYRKTTEEDLRWQFYVYMAYGIKNFTYFTYRDSLFDSMGDSCVSRLESCVPHAQYYWAQKVNGEIHAIDDIYLDYEWYGTLPVVGSNNAAGSNGNFNGLTAPLTGIDCLTSVSAEQDTLIGQLKDKDGNDALIVTNFTDPSASLNDRIRLVFNTASALRVFIRGKEYKVSGNTLSLSLGSGEGILVIPVI